MRESLTLGKTGELVAANYLLSKGWVILERNWFNAKGYRIGELDLIARDKQGMLVFVEIKTRKGRKGEIDAKENLNYAKFRKLVKIAQSYLNQKGWQGKNWRIDLIAVTMDFQTRKLALQHIKALHF